MRYIKRFFWWLRGWHVIPSRPPFNIMSSDTCELPHITRALYIGGDGDVRVEMYSGQIITFMEANSGSVIPIRVIKVFATGTTATRIVGIP